MLEAYFSFTGGAYEAHQHLESVFKKRGEVSERKYIFALDGRTLFVRCSEPNGKTSGWAERQNVKTGDALNIVMTGMPLKKKGARNGRKATSVPLRSDEERTEWAIRKLSENGFAVGPLLICDHDVSVEKPRHRHIVINGIRINGSVTVTDEVKANKAITTGIGEGKPYGFGTIIIED